MVTKKTLGRSLLPSWVYLNLANYGNCSIAPWRIKTLGEEKIKEDLLNHGFDCIIRIKDAPYDSGPTFKILVDQYVILEVRRISYEAS